MLLHNALSNGVFVDINPAPDMFDSVRPNLSLTIRDALLLLDRQLVIKVNWLHWGNWPKYGTMFRRNQIFVKWPFSEFTSIDNNIKEAPMFVDGPFNIENGYVLGKRALMNKIPLAG